MGRRLFSPEIVSSDAFLEMPISSQALYFHLAMNADDDGFVNPRKIMRMIGTQDDDLKVLLSKRFLLNFKSGVVVIKHWLIHNSIRKDRYKETRYLEEKNSIFIKDNMAYTDNPQEGQQTWQPHGNQLATQVKLSKDNNTPASQEQTNNKNMKNSFKYNENQHTDAFEDTIDADTGEMTTNKKQPNFSKVYKSLTDWAEKRRGSKFVNIPKQYKALSVMRSAGISQNEIMNRWAEMENDSYWSKNGFDFMNIATSFDKKR